MTLEKVTLKNVKVTINFDIDLDTFAHYLETKEADKITKNSLVTL